MNQVYWMKKGLDTSFTFMTILMRRVKLLFQTQIKNIIQAIQSLAGHVHPPTEHSKNV
jgi:hypothetical protein